MTKPRITLKQALATGKLDQFIKERDGVDHAHMDTNLTRHAPSRLIRNAKLPLQFLSGNTVTAISEQEYGMEPHLQRQVSVFKEGADAGVDMIAAPLTSKCPLRSDTIKLGIPITLTALMLKAITGFHDMLKASRIIGELLVKFTQRNAFHNNLLSNYKDSIL